jgi:hypothetical protein
LSPATLVNDIGFSALQPGERLGSVSGPASIYRQLFKEILGETDPWIVVDGGVCDQSSTEKGRIPAALSGGAAGNRTRRINRLELQEHRKSLRESTRKRRAATCGYAKGVDGVNTAALRIRMGPAAV